MELAVAPVVIEEVESRTVHKQLAMFEALRRLGFATDEIYVSWSGRPFTFLRVADHTYTISYPESKGHSAIEAEWFTEWLVEANRWNNEMTKEDREKIYKAHVSAELVGVLKLTLKARGFRIKQSEN